MGFILWEGNSPLTNEPVVAIVTGEDEQPSENSKTGQMVQVWVLRTDMDPLAASRTGKDEAICGNCFHRGTPSQKESGWAKDRSCYVHLTAAPWRIYEKYILGGYPKVSLRKAASLLKEKVIRWGAYGDPVCIPLNIVAKISSVSAGWSGYTHQWHKGFTEYQKFFMASTESVTQTLMAQSKGWRTFRVGDQAPELKEVLCPASKEAGMRTTCQKCLLCSGETRSGAKSVFIPGHGSPVLVKILNRKLKGIT